MLLDVFCKIQSSQIMCTLSQMFLVHKSSRLRGASGSENDNSREGNGNDDVVEQKV